MTDHINDAQQTLRQLVAANLVSLRKRQGLSQEALAAKAGLHRNQIGLLERGSTNPTLEILALIAITLGVRVVDLFDESVEKESTPKPAVRKSSSDASDGAHKRKKTKQ